MTVLRTVLAVSCLVLIIATPLLYHVQQGRDFRNFRVVVDGTLYRSGQLTPEGLDQVIRDYRIGTVVCLRDRVDDRNEFENRYEDAVCAAHGTKLIRFPYLSWDAPDGSRPADANVERFLALFTDATVKKPVLVHCFAGIHRTGGYVAGYRIARCQWTPAEALTELQSVGTPRTTYAPNLIGFVNGFATRR